MTGVGQDLPDGLTERRTVSSAEDPGVATRSGHISDLKIGPLVAGLPNITGSVLGLDRIRQQI